MDKVRKPSNSVCYTPSTEPYRIYSDYVDVDYDWWIGRCVAGSSCGLPKCTILSFSFRNKDGKRLTTSVKTADRLLGFESALTTRQSVWVVHFYKRKKNHYSYFTVKAGRQAHIINRNVTRRHRQGHYLKTVFKAYTVWSLYRGPDFRGLNLLSEQNQGRDVRGIQKTGVT
jgi:hypothetical protein